MSKKIPLYLALILIVAAVAVTFNATYVLITQKHNAELNKVISGYSFYDELLSLDSAVRKNYIGEIDDQTLKEALLRAYVENIGDKYSAFMTSDEYQTFLNENEGNTVGIGINVIYEPDTGNIEVLSVVPDSPAQEAGILSGDLLTAVNGEQVAELGYYGAIDKVRGEIGSEVTVTMLRDGNAIDFVCKRANVITHSVEYRVSDIHPSIGIIRISEFNSTTPKQFREALTDLASKGCMKYVFDLRNNGGGELNSIIETLDIILPEGPIAHIFFADGTTKEFSSDEKCLDSKICVLVNGNTASAAELFACSIQDYAKKNLIDASVVGTVTYGKGVLQSFYILKDGSAFKISTGHYDPPFSGNYDGIGVIPDIEVELSEEASAINFYKLTEKNDNQLIKAIEYLQS